MSVPRIAAKADGAEQDARMLSVIEEALAHYREWSRINLKLRSQLTHDFSLAAPTIEDAVTLLQRFALLAEVLGLVAQKIEAEVEETTDQFYTWLTD